MAFNKIAFRQILTDAMDLSVREKAVLDVLVNQKMARNVSKISKDAKVPRTTAIYIVHKFVRWKIVSKVKIGKSTHWMFNRQLNYHDKANHKF